MAVANEIGISARCVSERVNEWINGIARNVQSVQVFRLIIQRIGATIKVRYRYIDEWKERVS